MLVGLGLGHPELPHRPKKQFGNTSRCGARQSMPNAVARHFCSEARFHTEYPDRNLAEYDEEVRFATCYNQVKITYVEVDRHHVAF